MKNPLLTMLVAALTMGAAALADEPVNTTEDSQETVKATYLLTGLHCPPCTRTVEKSLQHVEGIRTIKVDWKTKYARIEFDESVLPAQKVSQLIADTPHMMGSGMHYAGWLTLQVPTIRDAATAKQAQEALSKIEGVKRVVADPKKHSLAVQFSAKGKLTSQQLIDVLKEAGIEAENM